MTEVTEVSFPIASNRTKLELKLTASRISQPEHAVASNRTKLELKQVADFLKNTKSFGLLIEPSWN